MSVSSYKGRSMYVASKSVDVSRPPTCATQIRSNFSVPDLFRRTIHYMDGTSTVSISSTTTRKHQLIVEQWLTVIWTYLLPLWIAVRRLEPHFFSVRWWPTSTGLLVYEHAITLAREIELFWKKPRRSWPFVLFVANRYVNVFGHIPYVITAFYSPQVTNYNVGCTYCTEQRFMAYSDFRL